MEEYLAKREALILEDRAKRVDHATSRASSSEERRADEITSLRESRWCSLRPQRLGVPEVKNREDLEREVEYNVYAC